MFFIKKIFNRVQLITSALFYSLFIFTFSKKLTIPTGEQIDDLKHSGFFDNKNTIDVTKLYQDARLANKKHTEGNYKEATKIHQNILEEIYTFNNINESTWSPMFLSYYFGGFLGHRALIGVLLAAQKFGMVSPITRILPYSGEVNEQQLKILFDNNKDIEIVRSDSGHRFLEGPLNWHLSERLWMIKTNQGFLETQEFTDKVFRRLQELHINSVLELDYDYVFKSQQELEKLGLPKNQEFVALHVRKKTWNDFDIRQAKVEEYSASVKELLRLGYYVVQIGTDPQAPILGDKRVIIVQGDYDLPRFLTPYVLAKSKFLINTCSGPTYLAALFGTPVLQTNVIAFGKSAITLSNNSIHIPKKMMYKGRELSLYELLSSPQGYSYKNIKFLNQSGFDLIENSSEEILNATKDILQLIQGDSVELSGMSAVKAIRENLQVPTNGNIAPSYIEKNESWIRT
jgi:putative glycosyltransferase (TIGR04372 family)